jgi:hypothetical protein
MPLLPNVERTPDAINSYVARQYSIASDAWELMAVRFSKAHSAATKGQEAVLQTVKARKLDQAKSEQFAINFVLSLITVGIAGVRGAH